MTHISDSIDRVELSPSFTLSYPPPLPPPPPHTHTHIHPPPPSATRGDNKKRSRGNSTTPSSSTAPVIARELDRTSAESETESVHPRKRANVGHLPIRTGPKTTATATANATNSRQPHPSWLSVDSAYTESTSNKQSNKGVDKGVHKSTSRGINKGSTKGTSSSSGIASIDQQPFPPGTSIMIKRTEYVMNKCPELAQTMGVVESAPVMPFISTPPLSPPPSLPLVLPC